MSRLPRQHLVLTLLLIVVLMVFFMNTAGVAWAAFAVVFLVVALLIAPSIAMARAEARGVLPPHIATPAPDAAFETRVSFRASFAPLIPVLALLALAAAAGHVFAVVVTLVPLLVLVAWFQPLSVRVEPQEDGSRVLAARFLSGERRIRLDALVSVERRENWGCRLVDADGRKLRLFGGMQQQRELDALIESLKPAGN